MIWKTCTRMIFH